MGFTSFVFLLIFLPLFLLLYSVTSAKHKNLMILCGSYIFYIWGSPAAALILLVTTLVDFLLVKLMASSIFDKQRKAIFVIALLENIIVLAYFKYSDFFIYELNNVISLFGLKPIVWASVLLPLGISFITFHKISYLMDVYYRKVHPAESFIDFAAYVAFFPKLIQGPIIRYHNIVDDLKSRHHHINDIFDGLFRFCVGLAKKVLIADVLGEVADKAFQANLNILTLTTSNAWLGIFCYTFQIYFDFSGYSDMAIGIARMLGFKFQENFNRPYLAKNFTEFWRRWHISLSNWFREYLYIPLGGNRVSTIRNYLNLWIVFLICGLWHGPNWTFIVWGIYHGLFIIADKLFLMKMYRKAGKTISFVSTFFFIMMGWVLFRSESIEFAVNYLRILFGGDSYSNLSIPLSQMISNQGIFVLIVAALISFIPETTASTLQKAFARLDDSQILWLKTGAIFLIICLSFSSLVNNGFTPFIYFRF